MGMRGFRANRVQCGIGAIISLAGVSMVQPVADQPLERWYEVRVGGKPAGWTRSVETRVPEGWRSESETRLRLSRGGLMLDSTSTGWMIENEAGQEVRGGRTQTGSGQSVRASWRYEADAIVESTIDGDRITERRLPPVAADAVPPHAAEIAAEALRSAGTARFSQNLFEPSQGPVAHAVHATREKNETIVTPQGMIETTRWRLAGDLVPAGTMEWRGAKGELMRSVSPTGLGDIESLATTEAAAKASLERAGSAPEVLVASFASPDRPLADVSKLRRTRLNISSLAAPLDAPPSIGVQRVKAMNGAFEVVVDLDVPALEATDVDRSNPAYLEASPAIDCKDPQVLTLAQTALVDASPDLQQRSERLRSAVFNHLNRKNLSSALASASEAVRTRSGDCTEHAVLLAALLRTQGIPSRVVVGLVWCERFAGASDVFGWHLWTQALIAGRWIDLDATLPAGGSVFHPGHVALATTALADPAGDAAWVRLLSAIGNLRIEVLDGAR